MALYFEFPKKVSIAFVLNFTNLFLQGIFLDHPLEKL